jgi:hypothetical protein
MIHFCDKVRNDDLSFLPESGHLLPAPDLVRRLVPNPAPYRAQVRVRRLDMDRAGRLVPRPVPRPVPVLVLVRL